MEDIQRHAVTLYLTSKEFKEYRKWADSYGLTIEGAVKTAIRRAMEADAKADKDED